MCGEESDFSTTFLDANSTTKLEFKLLQTTTMSFDSNIEHSDVESIGSLAHMCETELDEDHEEVYCSDPEGPYMDEPIADDEWLAEYNREVEQNERRNQELQNHFDRNIETASW